MNIKLTANTEVVLLLTAPLIASGPDPSQALLQRREYREVVRLLSKIEHELADLIGSDSRAILQELKVVVDPDRLDRLLSRSFELAQAIESWQSRCLWVLSDRDQQYPQRFKLRLRDHAPAVIYGAGNPQLCDTGGLAVVGSREVDTWLIEYTESIGQLAARAEATLISGGARGVDQASMRGALEAGGKAIALLADSLDRAASNRAHRELLTEERLVLVSPYDPAAGFNVGNAMQRNRLIYALADAALVVNSDLEKGGTWAGAVEQLEKFQIVPVYLRSLGERSEGLDALRHKGAIPWPNPTSSEDLLELLSQPVHRTQQLSLL